MKKQSLAKKIFLIAVGVLMITIGIHFFLVPNNLSLGGGFGIALILSKILPLDTGLILVIINIVLFAVGFATIGNAFGVWTVISSLGLSGAVWLFERVFPVQAPVIPNNVLLNLLVAVLLYGSGVAIVLNQSASTGGSDIISKILNKFTGIDLGKGCLITDFLITLFAGFTYGIETGVYCLLGVIINGMVIDYVIDGMNEGKYCIIHTCKPTEVANFLIENGRSATIYDAVGAYSKNPVKVVAAVVSTRDFIRLKDLLKAIDKNVFMVVNNVHNIIGLHWQDIND